MLKTTHSAMAVLLCFVVVNLSVYGYTCTNYSVCGVYPVAVHILFLSMQMCNFSFGLVCGLFLPVNGRLQILDESC
jgi:hypothetical protein